RAASTSSSTAASLGRMSSASSRPRGRGGGAVRGAPAGLAPPSPHTPARALAPPPPAPPGRRGGGRRAASVRLQRASAPRADGDRASAPRPARETRPLLRRRPAPSPPPP